MKSKLKFYFPAYLIVLALFATQGGCEMSCTADDGPLEEAAENVEDAAEDVGDAVEVDVD